MSRAAEDFSGASPVTHSPARFDASRSAAAALRFTPISQNAPADNAQSTTVTAQTAAPLDTAPSTDNSPSTIAGWENDEEDTPDLTKIGGYQTGSSNKDGGVAEIIAYDEENGSAWVVNGATAKIDIIQLPNAVDLVEDGKYDPKNYENAVAAYMPDGIAAMQVGGAVYLLTANEGDSREWGEEDTDAEYNNEEKTTLTAADGTEAEKVRTIDPDVTDGLPAGKT